MMLSKPVILLIIALYILAGCTNSTSPGGKVWFFTHYSGTKEPLRLGMTPASFIDLERDSTYSSDMDHFNYGKWRLTGKQLMLISHDSGKIILPIEYSTPSEMQVGPPTGPFVNFESQPLHFSSPDENPFSKANNQWRIGATNKETDAAIKKRMLNHFKFWEMYFTWALTNNVQYIDVRSTPTPIKIYGNGFTLKPFNELPEKWKNYFFDEEDCNTASLKIKYVFQHNLVNWPHTDNKYKMFISAFQQLQQHLP